MNPALTTAPSAPPRHYYIPMTPPRTCKAMLPRPSCIPVFNHKKITKIQQNKDKPTTQKVRPSCIPVFKHKKQEPVPQVTQPKVQQITNSLPRPCKENTRKQPTQVHPDPTPVRKSPFLPTIPAQSRQTVIPEPSTLNSSRKPTFTRPSVFNNNRFHQQPFIARPSLIYNTVHQHPYTPRPFNHQQIPLLPLPSHQIPAFTGPYPQTPGHYTQQVYYIPVLLPYLPQYYTA